MAGITAISELLSRITPDLPGCPSLLITQAMQDVIRDFCINTECWQVAVTQNLTVSTLAYTLDLGDDYDEADIRRIVKVVINESVEPVEVDLYTFDGDDLLTLDESIEPDATITDGLVTTVVIVPQLNSNLWEADLLNRYSQAIVYGVFARLMDNDKEGWGNPRRALDFKREYERQTALARIEMLRKYRTGTVRMNVRSWL
jgi:hypothetical protein